MGTKDEYYDTNFKMRSLRILLAFLMSIAALLAFYASNQRYAGLVLIVPLVYCIGFLMLVDLLRFIETPAMFVVNAIYAMRYFVYPISVMLNPAEDYIVPIVGGVLLMCYEEIVSVVVFFLLRKRLLTNKELAQTKKDLSKFDIRALLIAAGVLSVLSMVVIFRNPDVLQRYQISFIADNIKAIGYEVPLYSGSTLSLFVVDTARQIIPVAIGTIFAKRYYKTKGKLYFLCSVVSLMFFSMAIIHTGDRGGVVLLGVSAVFYMMFLFPDQTKKLFYGSMSVVFVLVVFLVLVRFLESFPITYLSDYLQAYFAGFKNMQAVVDLTSGNWIQFNLSTLFNDFFGNVPIINHLTNDNKLLIIFNEAVGRPTGIIDQVPPLAGNGAYYFGLIFAPLFTAIMIRVVVFIDSLYGKANTFLGVFVYSFIGANIAFCHLNHIQLILQYVTITISFLYFTYLLTRVFSVNGKLSTKVFVLLDCVFHVLPFKKKYVFFSSFSNQYNDNPKYIAMKLHEMDESIVQVWPISERTILDDIPDYVLKVQEHSIKHAYYKNRCSIIVENGAGIYYVFGKKNKMKIYNLLKKRGQINYSTWHGTPFKRIGIDSVSYNDAQDYTFVTTSDKMFLNSVYCKKILQQAFLGELDIELVGSPRNDILFLKDNRKLLKTKEHLGLPLDKKVVVYAPTFRDGRNQEENYTVTIKPEECKRIVEGLERKFGGEWVFVFRVHQFMITKNTFDLAEGIIINGNLHEDMAEYLFVSDALITDYSSSIYDYALTDKPCFIYAPDYNEYINEIRGVYSQIETFPYSVGYSVDELVDNIQNYSGDITKEKTVAFNEKIRAVDDGHASERIAKMILKKVKR